MSRYNEIYALSSGGAPTIIIDGKILAVRADFTQEDLEIQEFMNSYGVFSLPVIFILANSNINTPEILQGPITPDQVLDSIERVESSQSSKGH